MNTTSDITVEDKVVILEQVLIQTRAQLAEAMAKNAELQALIAVHNQKNETDQEQTD